MYIVNILTEQRQGSCFIADIRPQSNWLILHLVSYVEEIANQEYEGISLLYLSLNVGR